MSSSEIVSNVDLGLGKCVKKGCDKYAIVGLNGANVCKPHMDEFLSGLGKGIKHLKESRL